MKLALIGCGAVAAKHAQAIKEDARAQLTWLCDIQFEAAQRFAAAHAPTAAIAARFSEIPLAEIDGLIICSPTADHFAQVSAALQAGKPVLCEKPLAANSEQIRQLISLRDASRRVLSVAFQRRTEAPYVTVRNLIADRRAEFGELQSMHLFVCERWAQTIEGSWRNDPNLGFGYFGDAGVHQIDSIAFMTGYQPRNVQARSDRRGRNVEVVTDVRSLWQNAGERRIPLTSQFVGDAQHWREDISLHFEHADVLLRSGEIQICRDNRCDTIHDLSLGSTPVVDFLSACEGRQETVAPAACGLLSAAWTESVLASIPRGEWIHLPPA